MNASPSVERQPSLIMSISCFIVMLVIIGVGKGIFNLPIQPLLICCAAYAAIVGYCHGFKWQDMEAGITKYLMESMPVMYILISVGIVIGTWIYSGTVPMFIYYGLKLINPAAFLPLSFVIVAIVSVATGTAWGSTATAGVALMGVAHQMGIPPAMACGAIIAGGVFGDKLSPLSDTTNLAALVTRTPLFTHIRHMLWTTIPSSIIGLIIWGIAGLKFSGNATAVDPTFSAHLEAIYNFNIILLLPAVIIIVGALLKYPTVPLMIISSVIAVILGILFHGLDLADGFTAALSGFSLDMVPDNKLTFEDENIASLLNRGGINSMLNIITTIFCGYAFAGIVAKIGCLKVLLGVVEKNINKRWKLVGVTILGSLLLVFTAGVASISIIMVGFLLKDAYTDLGLASQNLSRTLEDAGTMWLPLVPWGASGIFYLEVLGVPTGSYFIWTIPCYLCIVFAMIYAVSGIAIKKIED